MKNKAIFLDRDGTINIDKEYLYKISEFEFVEGIYEFLKYFQDLEYKLIVITNQSGIARGFYTENDMHKLHNYMCLEFEKKGIKIDKIYFCPHLDGDCNCRKPKLGMFYEAQKDFNIDFTKSYAIGDKLRDLAICEKEKVKGILISNENNIEVNPNVSIYKTIKEARNFIKNV